MPDLGDFANTENGSCNSAKMINILGVREGSVFKLTRQEQLIVAFVLSALLLGTAAREWRARHPKAVPAATTETRAR